MRPHQRRASLGRRIDDPLPVVGRNVAPVPPLSNSDTTFANVRGKRLSVAFPDFVNGGEV